jgi:hypothetical protein
MTPLGGSRGNLHRTARVCCHARRRGSRVAARGARMMLRGRQIALRRGASSTAQCRLERLRALRSLTDCAWRGGLPSVADNLAHSIQDDPQQDHDNNDAANEGAAAQCSSTGRSRVGRVGLGHWNTVMSMGHVHSCRSSLYSANTNVYNADSGWAIGRRRYANDVLYGVRR